jgi:hypothetical protein
MTQTEFNRRAHAYLAQLRAQKLIERMRHGKPRNVPDLRQHLPQLLGRTA